MDVEQKRKSLWVKDEDVDTCTICQTEFTLINRKHHCRRCLNIFCNSCSSKRERLVLFGYPKERVRVCNTCFPQAERENEFEEIHVVLMLSGGVFHRHRKTGSPVPIFMALAQNRRELEWRSVELVHNRAQGVERIMVADLTSITEAKTSKTTFEITAGSFSLKLDAGSLEHRNQWVSALREGMEMLLKDIRGQVDDQILKRTQSGSSSVSDEPEILDEKELRKLKRNSTINALREKYHVRRSTYDDAD